MITVTKISHNDELCDICARQPLALCLKADSEFKKTDDSNPEYIEMKICTDCAYDLCTVLYDAVANRDATVKSRHMYSVEITETLQLSVDCEATGMDEARAIVRSRYNNGIYVLSAEHFTGVEFSVSGKGED